MIAKLRGIEGTKKECDAINKKIHEYMIKTIPNYKAKQWSEVIEHRTIPKKYIIRMPANHTLQEKILNSKEKSLINSNIIERDYCIQFDEFDE